jgi:hypothetical protein
VATAVATAAVGGCWAAVAQSMGEGLHVSAWVCGLLLLVASKYRTVLLRHSITFVAWLDCGTTTPTSTRSTAAEYGEKHQVLWRRRIWRWTAFRMLVRVMGFQLVGCWIFQYAIGQINAHRRLKEGPLFERTGNALPYSLRAANGWVVIFWAVAWLHDLLVEATLVWYEGEQVRLRLQALRQQGMADLQVTTRSGGGGGGGGSSGCPPGLILWPVCGGQCGLPQDSAGMRAQLVRGAGIVIGRKPAAACTQQSPLTPPSPSDARAELRQFCSAHQVNWCDIMAPRLSTLHCSLLRTTSADERHPTTKDDRLVGYELRDHSVGQCVYLNDLPLPASAEPANETELKHGRIPLRWGDKISMTVCASPFAELAYVVLPLPPDMLCGPRSRPDDEYRGSWWGRCTAIGIESHTVSGSSSSSSTQRTSEQSSGELSGSKTAADSPGRLGASAERPPWLRQHAVVARHVHAQTVTVRQHYFLASAACCCVALALLLVAGFALLLQLVPQCSAAQYIQVFSGALKQAAAGRSTNSRTRDRAYYTNLQCLLAPEGILFLWVILYTVGVVGSAIAFQCVYVYCSRNKAALAELGVAAEELARLETSIPGSSSADGATAALSADASTMASASGFAAAAAAEGGGGDDLSGYARQAQRVAARLTELPRGALDSDTTTLPTPYTLPAALLKATQSSGGDLVCPISLVPMAHAMTLMPCGHVFDRHSVARHFARAQLASLRSQLNANRRPSQAAEGADAMRCPLNCPCVAGSVLTLVANPHVRAAVRQVQLRTPPPPPRPSGQGDRKPQEQRQEEDEVASETALDATIFRTAENQKTWATQLSNAELPLILEPRRGQVLRMEVLQKQLEDVNGVGSWWAHASADGGAVKVALAEQLDGGPHGRLRRALHPFLGKGVLHNLLKLAQLAITDSCAAEQMVAYRRGEGGWARPQLADPLSQQLMGKEDWPLQPLRSLALLTQIASTQLCVMSILTGILVD